MAHIMQAKQNHPLMFSLKLLDLGSNAIRNIGCEALC